MPRIDELTIYPVKSAKGFQLNSMCLGDRGPALDRRWMLVDEHNKFITQRKYPKLFFHPLRSLQRDSI